MGSGGREHALAWRLADEAEVVCAPGNPGMASDCACEAVDVADVSAVVDLARRVAPELVLVGPEAPLIEGFADALRGAGQFVVGPNRDGAQLEGSKAHAKQAMLAAGVPTAASQTFMRPTSAHAYARKRFEEGRPVVVKASGAALGKGVLICESAAEARDAIERTMVAREFGEAGATVVIEDFVEGREFSLLTLCSDGRFLSLPVAQDYKRAGDGDLGPNTGGMGTFSPVSWVDEAMVARTEERVVAPMLRYLESRGVAFRGVLFSGLMVVGPNPICLEYNVRFGDPETQTVMMRLGGGLAEALQAVSRGWPLPPIEVRPGASVSVVVASKGYPGDVSKGRMIGLPVPEPDTKIFHAGTAETAGKLVTAGGRVLAASAYAPDLATARAKAYALAEGVRFDGAWYRNDIAGDA